MTVTSIYLVRHGETDWNTQHKLQGHTDIPLNETGKSQAKALQKVLLKEKIDAVFSSDLKRAVETAEILSSHLPLTVIKDEALRERKFGPFEGLTVAEYKEQYKNLTGQNNHPFQGPFEEKWHEEVESTPEVLNRVFTFISGQIKLHPEKTLLIVSHGGVIHGTLRHLGLQEESISIKNCAYLHLKWTLGEEKPQIVSLIT